MPLSPPPLPMDTVRIAPPPVENPAPAPEPGPVPAPVPEPEAQEAPPGAPAEGSAPVLKDAYDARELEVPLAPLTRPPPVYPPRARRRSIEGWVTVKFLVDKTGRVASVSILESHPGRIFDDTVLRCVKGWRFRPGMVEGMPVNTWARTTIHFRLD